MSFAAMMLLMTMPAWASSQGDATGSDFSSYATATANKTSVLVDIFSYVSYFVGAVFAALGVSDLRRVADGSAGGQISLRQPLAKIFFGGLFLALPFATMVMQDMMAGGSAYEVHSGSAYRFGPLNIQDGALSGFIANGIFNVAVLIDVAAVASYIIGVFLVMRGIQLLRLHVDNPAQHNIADALKRLGAGGALFGLPFMVHVIRQTFGVNSYSGGIAATGWSTSNAGGSGLDGKMLNFVSDVVNPSIAAIEIFCFVAGVVMAMFAIQRMIKSAQDGPRGPLTAGTIAMFVVSGLLISFPQLMEALNISITGGSAALTQVNFMSESGSGELDQSAKNVISGVLAFMAVVGFLSVVRGLFLLKTLAEGGQATLMQVVVHLVAGALCVNLGALINAVQTTLGIGDFLVTFS